MDRVPGGSRDTRKVRHARAGHAPVRLTRRGRLAVVVAAGLTMALASAFVLTMSDAISGSGTGVAGVHRGPERTVVVRPGETVWGIAERLDAHADPRELIARIADLNGLADAGSVDAGDRLLVPVSR